jgi:hypothetical protein
MSYNHYPEYTDDVEAKLNDISAKIEEGVQGVIDAFNDTIGSKDWMWLVSPAVKAAYEWARDNLEDEIQRLWDEFKQVCEDTWEQVDDLTGDPWQLMEMNAAYLSAASRIRDEKRVIDNLTSEVSRHWSGVAYDAYSHVATEQTNAINAVDQGLVKAATACAEGAQQIRSIWRDCIDAMLDVVNSIADAIKDGTDAGQWVTFDAGPAIKVVLKVAVKALALWNQLDRYFDENATVKLSMWRELNSGLDGLDANNDWPSISSRDSGDIDDRGSWSPK